MKRSDMSHICPQCERNLRLETHFLVWWVWIHRTPVVSTITSSQSNQDIWDELEQETHISWQIYSDSVMPSWQYEPNVSNYLLNLSWIIKAVLQAKERQTQEKLVKWSWVFIVRWNGKIIPIKTLQYRSLGLTRTWKEQMHDQKNKTRRAELT